jgi:MFS family permease
MTSQTLRAMLGGCAVGVTIGWPLTNVGAVADSIRDDYGVALATVGLFTTALFIVHTLMQIPAGKAVDRLGARRVAALSLVIGVVANAVALIAPAPGLAIAMRALAGFGTAFGFVSGIDYVRSQGGSSLMQGLFGGISLGTGGVALAVVPQAEHWIGWRAPFVTQLIVIGAAAFVLALGPPDAAGLRPRRLPLDGAPGIFGDRRLYRLCVVYMASFGLSVVLSNWVVPLLTRGAGYSDGLAGAVGSLILAGGIVSRPLGGHFVRTRPGRLRVVLGIGCAASLLGTGLLTIAGAPAVSVAGALVFGLAAGIPFAPAFAAAARLRPDSPAVATALVNMSANVVIVTCTPLLGLSFSLPGDGRIGFAASGVLWLLALAVLPRAKELDAVS